MRHTTVTRKLLPYPLTRPNFHVRVAINDAIKYRTAAPPVIAVRGWCDGDFHVFSVRNNGIGIAPEYGQAIFQLFKRLHVWVQVPGRGIGLAVCKRIVEYHGGRIRVESAPGHGATFYFTLPCARRFLRRQTMAR